MATNNSGNNQFTNNSDGFDLSGGTTARKLTVSGGDVSFSASGSNIFTFPATTDTLVGRTSTDTLTNKTIDAASNTITNLDASTLAESVGNFGAWKDWTPTLTGFSTVPPNAVYRYMQIGKMVTLNISALAGTSNSNAITFTLPIAAATITNNVVNAWARAQDNGTIGTTPGLVEFSSTAIVAVVYKDHSGTAWTTTGTKGFRTTFSYEVD